MLAQKEEMLLGIKFRVGQIAVDVIQSSYRHTTQAVNRKIVNEIVLNK